MLFHANETHAQQPNPAEKINTFHQKEGKINYPQQKKYQRRLNLRSVEEKDMTMTSVKQSQRTSRKEVTTERSDYKILSISGGTCLGLSRRFLLFSAESSPREPSGAPFNSGCIKSNLLFCLAILCLHLSLAKSNLYCSPIEISHDGAYFFFIYLSSCKFSS